MRRSAVFHLAQLGLLWRRRRRAVEDARCHFTRTAAPCRRRSLDDPSDLGRTRRRPASGQTPQQIDFPGEVVAIQGAPGAIVDNSGLIPFDQAFFAFEVENVLGSLKEVPNWDELEKMLDNPYQIALAPELGLNTQGFPSYVSTQPRRRSFVYRDANDQPCPPGTPGCNEVPLPPLVVHLLNYNYMSGEEMRLLNFTFRGSRWELPDELIGPFPDPNGGPNEYIWNYRPVSTGRSRIDPAEGETPIDFNSPIKPDEVATILSLEPNPETSTFAAGTFRSRTLRTATS